MEEKQRILLCEDDENLGMLLREYLQAKGYYAELCPDGDAGYKAFLKVNFDICVFDVMMPIKDGFTLAQEIRQVNTEVPIIFLTAKTLNEDILEGFKIGADDYITKPFSLSVLRARVNTQLRKAAAMSEKEKDNEHVYRKEPYVFDFDRMKFMVDGKEIELSKTEQKLLRILVENAGMNMRRELLLDRVWSDGAEYVDENALSVSIKRLRDKLGAEHAIRTVYGIGYRWE